MSFICLTIVGNKQKVYVRAERIQGIDKNPQNDLETVVMTNIMAVGGPVMYSVLDDAGAIAKAVVEAEKTHEIQTPGPRIQ